MRNGKSIKREKQRRDKDEVSKKEDRKLREGGKSEIEKGVRVRQCWKILERKKLVRIREKVIKINNKSEITEEHRGIQEQG